MATGSSRSAADRVSVNVLPLLGPRRRRTLGELLERVHPAHSWLGALS